MRKGFTLVELAIVLTIVGLILGSAVIGASLIQSARLQTIITDYQKYKTATSEFKEKYAYYPGDFPNAYNYWGSSSNGTGTCTDNDVNSVAGGCKGNGDGQIRLASVTATLSEGSGFWTQLVKAGFISTAVNTPEPMLGPKTQVPGGYFFADYVTVSSVEANFLMIQKSDFGALFNPADAYSIDLKIDDGLPEKETGQVFASEATGACFIVGSSPTAYNVSLKTTQCLLYFKLQ